MVRCSTYLSFTSFIPITATTTNTTAVIPSYLLCIPYEISFRKRSVIPKITIRKIWIVYKTEQACGLSPLG